MVDKSHDLKMKGSKLFGGMIRVDQGFGSSRATRLQAGRSNHDQSTKGPVELKVARVGQANWILDWGFSIGIEPPRFDHASRV